MLEIYKVANQKNKSTSDECETSRINVNKVARVNPRLPVLLSAWVNKKRIQVARVTQDYLYICAESVEESVGYLVYFEVAVAKQDNRFCTCLAPATVLFGSRLQYAST